MQRRQPSSAGSTLATHRSAAARCGAHSPSSSATSHPHCTAPPTNVHNTHTHMTPQCITHRSAAASCGAHSPSSSATSRASAPSLYRRSAEPAERANLPLASLLDCLPPALALGVWLCRGVHALNCLCLSSPWLFNRQLTVAPTQPLACRRDPHASQACAHVCFLNAPDDVAVERFVCDHLKRVPSMLPLARRRHPHPEHRPRKVAATQQQQHPGARAGAQAAELGEEGVCRRLRLGVVVGVQQAVPHGEARATCRGERQQAPISGGRSSACCAVPQLGACNAVMAQCTSPHLPS